MHRLAESLYIANRRPEDQGYALKGSEFIMAVPGPADTVAGRVYLNQSWR